MDTVEKILHNKLGNKPSPYPKPIRLNVVKTKEKEDRLEVSFADQTGAIKGYIYSKDLYSKFQPGKAVLLRNYSKGQKAEIIMINAKTKITQSTPLTIPETILQAAQLLVDPPAPQPTAFKDINEESSQTVTVQGIVIQDEVPKTFPQGTVRNITMKDSTGAMQIALWNRNAHSPIKMRDNVRMTHLSPKKNNYLKALALNTTSHTDITTEQPSQEQIEVDIIGVETEGDSIKVSLLFQDNVADYNMKHSVATETWMTSDPSIIMTALEDISTYKLTVQADEIIHAIPCTCTNSNTL